MKQVQAIKPPWVLPASAWQHRPRAAVSLPAALTFSAWSEAPSASDLAAAKAKISPLEESNRWELIKKMVNPYEMVYTHEDPHFPPSISLIKPLSRSYFKLIEMMHVLQFFEQLPKQTPKIRTAHIAEGPGGFIQAVAELTTQQRKILEKATAMTLKPTDQRVPGWRRAATFLQHHREVKLHYGIDGTGDIYQLGNQDSFVETVAPGVHLFTADGGFDFSINYNIQEQRVFHLLACSITIGLRSLSKGGSMVLKVFDMFSESTRVLLLLLSRCFKEWTFYKPTLSRPCNSERYFLGRNFLGVSKQTLQFLLDIQRESLNDQYPVGFAELAMAEEADYFTAHMEENTRQQLDALTRADHYVAHPEDWYTNQLPHDFETSLHWCRAFRVPPGPTKPVSLACPPHLLQAAQTSLQSCLPQSPSPGDVSDSHSPCDPAAQASCLDAAHQIPPSQLPSQTDARSPAQTQELSHGSVQPCDLPSSVPGSAQP